MITIKKALFATAAVIALGTGMTPKSAHAFDNVNWSWDKTVTETVIKDVNINIENNPSGMLELEKIQTQVGDVTATSNVHDIKNNPPSDGAGDGTVSIDTTIDLTADYDSNQAGNPVTGLTINSPGFTDGNASGSDDQNANQVHLTFDLQGDVPFTPEGAQDAADLPSILSDATAVGNNQQIASDVSLELHDGQFLYGGYNPEYQGQPLMSINTSGVSGNVNTNAAAWLTFASALGGLEPASITASSDVSSILNASVDSTATAVGNNTDIALTATTPADALMIGDLTQYAYADVSATSSVNCVSVNGYANMSALDGPLVSSRATAVGNNMSIKVTSPSL